MLRQESFLQRDLEMMEQRLEAAAWDTEAPASSRSRPDVAPKHVQHRQVQSRGDQHQQLWSTCVQHARM